MTTAPISDVDSELAVIPEAVTATGYADFMSCISPHGVRQAAWRRCGELVDGELRQTVGLLLLGERVPAAGLPGPVRDILPVLARCAGRLDPGTTIRARLCEADPDTATVRFTV